MARCSCGVEVGYVYDADDELIVIDQERSEEGNVVLEGRITGHRVAPGLGTHRVHECATGLEAA